MAASLPEQVSDIEKRLALIEVRLEQLFEHLDVAPRGGGSGASGSEPVELDPNQDPEIQDLLAKGNETQAIKRYRELSGLGLKEAKEAIDRARTGG